MNLVQPGLFWFLIWKEGMDNLIYGILIHKEEMNPMWVTHEGKIEIAKTIPWMEYTDTLAKCSFAFSRTFLLSNSSMTSDVMLPLGCQLSLWSPIHLIKYFCWPFVSNLEWRMDWTGYCCCILIDSSPRSRLEFDSPSSQYPLVVFCRPDNSLSEEDSKKGAKGTKHFVCQDLCQGKCRGSAKWGRSIYFHVAWILLFD